MRIASLRLWIGEVLLLVLFLDGLGCLVGAVNLHQKHVAGILENDLSGAHARWARPKGLSVPRTRRSQSVLEVGPSHVNGTAEADLLLEFRKGVTRDPTNVLSSWNSDNVSSYCSWTGVICSRPMGPVSALNLSGHNLTGTISPALGGLQSLSSLDLSNNSFGGSIDLIPAELPALSNLEELDLSSNQLTGAIPSSLSNLSALKVLSLHDNLIQGGLGSLDWGGFAHLESVDLSSNQIAGAIPESFRNCSDLVTLDLTHNNLSGIITDIFGGLRKLQVLVLQYNSLTGSIPPSLGSLQALSVLAFSDNFLTGSIPPSLVNCSNLTNLLLDSNNLTGEIPAEIGWLSQLQYLYLWDNSLTGPIPVSLMNCSSLTDMILNSNNLTGEIPAEIGSLSQLQYLYLWDNSLAGPIPLNLMNCSSLTDLILTANYLGGEIPKQLGMLKELNFLYLGHNNFSGGIPDFRGNSFLLEILLDHNSLTGLVPPELGLLKSLSQLDLSHNFLVGEIPTLLRESTALIYLYLAGNGLSGPIPPWIGELINLQGLNLSNNFLTGGIPLEIFNCTELSVLDLSGNMLTGSLPNEIGSLSVLSRLYLNNNNFTGSISSAIRQKSGQKSTSLLAVSLAHNSFSGVIAGLDFGSLRTLQLSLDLSYNLLSGTLPLGIGALDSVQKINFSFNNFSGGIPEAFSQCIGLESLDLSSNNLDGKIPESLTTLPYLTFFNASFNQLVGSIPESGPFANFTNESFLGNPNLCGPKLSHLCNMVKNTCHGIHCHQLLIILLVVVGSIIVALALATLWCWFKPKMSHLSNTTQQNKSSLRNNLKNMIDRVAVKNGSHGIFLEALVLQTIDDPRGDNIIGRGARSIVYKGIMPRGEVFALKRLLSNNVDNQIGEENKKIEELLKEVEMLAKLRHKNILKVLSFYSSLDHKALILEYASGGSLHQHLHQMESCLLTWETRLKIAMNVAQAMKYLHHDFPEPLIHRDLKPSNILLDDNFEPKVADFGISKFVSAQREDGEASASTLCGTIGYMPPEYASQPWVSTKGDVFSFGMIIIELLTRRQPGSTNMVENQGKDLRSWILENFHERPIDLLDHMLVSECKEDNIAMEQMVLLLRVGIFCTSMDPENRPSMIDVVGMLTNIVNILNVDPIIRRTKEELIVDNTNLCTVQETEDVPQDPQPQDPQPQDPQPPCESR